MVVLECVVISSVLDRISSEKQAAMQDDGESSKKVSALSPLRRAWRGRNLSCDNASRGTRAFGERFVLGS